jgi:CheY-like chemotaxis protein
MELAAALRTTADADGIQILLADGEPRLRSLTASSARDALEGCLVLEADDGAEAIQLALRRRPQIALLEVEMRRVGGIEAAITLRELRPRMRLALQTADPTAYRERADRHRLPLFDKAHADHAVAWLQAQVEWYIERPLELRVERRRALACALCGYGVFRSTPPKRCPMCQAEDAWVEARKRSSGVPVAG